MSDLLLLGLANDLCTLEKIGPCGTALFDEALYRQKQVRYIYSRISTHPSPFRVWISGRDRPTLQKLGHATCTVRLSILRIR